jgi:shikimate dehydrogenase
MKRFGLIGKSLVHSFSESYFNDKFKKQGIKDVSYQNFELDSIDDFRSLIKSEKDLIGLNVTIPYKEAVIPFLDEVSEEVKAIGAVNTIVVSAKGLKGFNTDYIGFRNSLKPFLEGRMERALILGTGGASKAAAYSLQQLGVQSLFVSRNPKPGHLSYEELNDVVLKHHLLIVNTTPLGTFPNINECPQIPYEYLTSQHLLFDLVYNPTETLFLKKGKEKGTMILNGQSMLVHQAEEAWKIWTT